MAKTSRARCSPRDTVKPRKPQSSSWSSLSLVKICNRDLVWKRFHLQGRSSERRRKRYTERQADGRMDGRTERQPARQTDRQREIETETCKQRKTSHIYFSGGRVGLFVRATTIDSTTLPGVCSSDELEAGGVIAAYFGQPSAKPTKGHLTGTKKNQWCAGRTQSAASGPLNPWSGT